MKQHVKKALALVLIVCLLITPFSAFNFSDSGITTRSLPSRIEGLNISGEVPELIPAAGTFYNSINERIDEVFTSLLSEARRARARSVAFSFEAYQAGNVVSIVLDARVSSVISRTFVRSINFCARTGQVVTLRNALDMDIVPLASRILADNMRRNPEHFYSIPTTLDNQAFFVDDNGLTIFFDEFQLSAMVSGVVTLELLHENIRTATITEEETLSPENRYNLVLVPLAAVVTQLGFGTGWDETTRRAAVMNGSEEIAWMRIGINNYHTPTGQRSLESAPYNVAGNTFVPITFFTQIFPLTVYSIDPNGNIVFLSYAEIIEQEEGLELE